MSKINFELLADLIKIIESKNKCPVCGGKHWVACDIYSDGIPIVFDTNSKAVVDLKVKVFPYPDFDMCLSCGTVITG
jgi:hypothetical protein